ncbi:hypothetical protein [Algoriphagus sp.]|uniref:hypothetical protein n=1 Tax=Algoriphagus sp. TaxID=1872435 RepID=UPI0025E71C21|nr:hypothetical protein [Algoriphagus sp.]
MLKMKAIKLHSRFFNDHGFILNPSQNVFEKAFPNGKQVISIQIIEYSNEKYIEYHLGVRINEVEELIARYLPTTSAYDEQSITLAQTPDKLGSTYSKKIKISKVEDLSKLCKSIETFFLETGFYWLDKMIDPIKLEQEFLHHNEVPFEDYSLVEVAFRSTALSKIYNPSDYPELRKAFLEKINSLELTPFIIASFLQFLNYLDKLNLEAA